MTSSSFVGHPRVAVLHALRIKGIATVDVVCEMTGLDAATVETATAAAGADGLMQHREGRISGWMLTPAGREAHATELAGEIEASGTRGVIESTYARFVELNQPFKQLCTEWQLSNRAPSVIDELVTFDASAQQLMAPIGDAVARFAPYSQRFRSALERVQAGDLDAFARPLTGSYHDVWMELHQDLLLSLGRGRGMADGH